LRRRCEFDSSSGLDHCWSFDRLGWWHRRSYRRGRDGLDRGDILGRFDRHGPRLLGALCGSGFLAAHARSKFFRTELSGCGWFRCVRHHWRCADLSRRDNIFRTRYLCLFLAAILFFDERLGCCVEGGNVGGRISVSLRERLRQINWLKRHNNWLGSNRRSTQRRRRRRHNRKSWRDRLGWCNRFGRNGGLLWNRRCGRHDRFCRNDRLGYGNRFWFHGENWFCGNDWLGHGDRFRFHGENWFCGDDRLGYGDRFRFHGEDRFCGDDWLGYGDRFRFHEDRFCGDDRLGHGNRFQFHREHRFCGNDWLGHGDGFRFHGDRFCGDDRLRWNL
jgi:hypothetical protein